MAYAFAATLPLRVVFNPDNGNVTFCTFTDRYLISETLLANGNPGTHRGQFMDCAKMNAIEALKASDTPIPPLCAETLKAYNLLDTDNTSTVSYRSTSQSPSP